MEHVNSLVIKGAAEVRLVGVLYTIKRHKELIYREEVGRQRLSYIALS